MHWFILAQLGTVAEQDDTLQEKLIDALAQMPGVTVKYE